MKASLLFASLALSLSAVVSAQAQTTAPAPAPDKPMRGDFATHKARILSHLDQRMAAMTTMRDCVNSAATSADLKTCHSQARSAEHGKHAPA